MKNGSDGIDRVARFEFLSEGMFDQFRFCPFFIILESGVEEGLEGRQRGRRWLTHQKWTKYGSRKVEWVYDENTKGGWVVVKGEWDAPFNQ